MPALPGPSPARSSEHGGAPTIERHVREQSLNATGVGSEGGRRALSLLIE